MRRGGVRGFDFLPMHATAVHSEVSLRRCCCPHSQV